MPASLMQVLLAFQLSGHRQYLSSFGHLFKQLDPDAGTIAAVKVADLAIGKEDLPKDLAESCGPKEGEAMDLSRTKHNAKKE